MKEYSTSHDRSHEAFTTYQGQLDQITHRPLTPECIDTYAEDALDDLISLIEEATSRYGQFPTIASDNTREFEESAFRYFNLANIESLLDHISSLNENVHHLDHVIEKAYEADTVFIPPQYIDDIEIEKGAGTYEKKKLIPRLKTLLFILQHDLLVNVSDPADVHIKKGKVGDGTMRDASYYSILTPTIDRLSLINDEEGNASYIFSLSELSAAEVTQDGLTSLNKAQLNELINSKPGIGKRIVYSKEYLNDVRDALANPIGFNEQKPTDGRPTRANKNTYLIPKLPEGYKSLSAIARDLKETNARIEDIIMAHEDELGEVGSYRSGVRTARAFSPDQQAIIGDYLKGEHGYVEHAPDGYQSARAIGSLLNIRADTIRDTIELLGDTLGEVKEYRFKSKVAAGYSPEQQQTIRDYLQSVDALTEKAPEGYLSVGNIAKQFGLSYSVIHSAISVLAGELGDTIMYRFGTITAVGYSPEQQQTIRDYLQSVDALAEKAPDDYLSARGIGLKINTNYQIVQKAIAALEDELGQINIYKFGAKVTAGFSPGQVDVVESYLKAHSKYYNSVKGVAKAAIGQTLKEDVNFTL